jgi:hypothetical protein
MKTTVHFQAVVGRGEIRAIALMVLLLWFGSLGIALAQEPAAIPRCQVVPLADDQVLFQIDGQEKLRWHFGKQYPRPFFFPFNGPSGSALTRMGHPGLENHDHHRSVWFANMKVNGLDFWHDHSGTKIRQKHWYAYRDGDDEAIMSSVTGWYDRDRKEVLEQDVVAALIALDAGEHALELQITMRPPKGGAKVELQQNNFGFLAVRVAKSISAHFGGGQLTSSKGQEHESNIFGKPARWMDYGGPVAAGKGEQRKTIVEGITVFDHPSNPRYPTHWHVRDDGWMGASFGMKKAYTITAEKPLTLRYLLHAHSGSYEHAKAEAVHKSFANRRGFEVKKSTRQHRQYEVGRRPK